MAWLTPITWILYCHLFWLYSASESVLFGKAIYQYVKSPSSTVSSKLFINDRFICLFVFLDVTVLTIRYITSHVRLHSTKDTFWPSFFRSTSAKLITELTLLRYLQVCIVHTSVSKWWLLLLVVLVVTFQGSWQLIQTIHHISAMFVSNPSNRNIIWLYI